MTKNIRQASIQEGPNAILRTITMLYSLASYLIGVAALVYLILFISDLWVPVTINRGAGFAQDAGVPTAIF